MRRLVFDTGLDREEILRVLAGVMGAPFVEEGEWLASGQPGHRCRLKLGGPSSTRLGSVRVALTHLELAYEGPDPDEEDAFLRRVRVHFQRGGG